MASRGSKKQSTSKAKAQETPAEEPHPYADYQPPTATPDRVEVRINNKIVFLDDVYGARFEAQASGLKVHGSKEPPKAKEGKGAQEHFYNPEHDEGVAGGAQVTPVPTPDPEWTEALNESATPDEDNG